MATKEFRDGAEMVGKAAEAKFNDIGNNVNDLKCKFSEYANQQEMINKTIIDRSDDHEERMRQLEENRYFVRSSRRGIEDLDPVQQDRMVGWLQKLVKEFNSRGFPVNRNQQKFLSNLLQLLGIMDDVAEVLDLSMMENFGNSEIHEVIYKIFLIFTYLSANNFDTLKNFEDISGFFKLSDQNKIDIRRLLEEERIPLLGLDGLVNIYDPSRALNSFKPQTLYANLREMSTHPLLEANAQEETRKLYIQGFALLAAGNNFCEEQYNYLRSLTNVLKCASALENLDQLCTSPQKFQVRKWVEALNSDSFKYSWLLDGTMVLCQLSEISKNIVKTDVLEEGAKSLRIMQPKEFIGHAVDLCLNESALELFKDIAAINDKTHGWEHILEYRNLNLDGAFEEEIDELNSLDSSLVDLNFKSTSLITDIDFNVLSYCDMSEFDEGFLEKMRSKAERTLVESGRSSASKKLKEYYDEVDSFIRSNISKYRKANSILDIFGIEQISVKNTMVDPELNNSASNEDWYDDYSGFMNKISNTLESYSDAAETLVEQLALFEKGQYHTSIIDRKKAEKVEKEKQEEAEREARKFVNISTAQGEYRVGMSWTKVEDVPFPLDDIDEVGYAGGNWLIMAKEPYYLDNAQKWHKASELSLTSVRKIFQCNEFIILTSYSDGTWISKDCKNWKKIELPTDDSILSVVYYKRNYVLFAKERETYTYTEKGIIFDSKEEGSYDSTIVWKSSSLDGDWEKWNDASYTYTGMSLKSNIACNDNVMIGSFAYDFCYQSNMKKSSDNACVAYFTNSRWKDATWPEDIGIGGAFYFLNNHGIFINTYNPVVLSENGYEWKEVEGTKVYEEGGICGDVFITKPDSDGQSVISLDGLSVSQLTVSEKGDWNKFAYGHRMVLGVYKKSKHESDLLIGELKIIPQ